MNAIMRLSDAPPKRRGEASAVLVDSFLHQLSAVSKDANGWKRAIEGALNENRFWVAERDGHIVGIAACSDGTERAIHADPKRVRRALGWLTGSIALLVLRFELQAKLPYPQGTGYIECVATREDARGSGVATALLEKMMLQAGYGEYVLEVIDTNASARRVYDRLGFVEFKRKKARNPRMMGFNERIYMRKSM